MSIEDKLTELGIALPVPPTAVANYVPFVITGSLLSISGQIPTGPQGPLYVGKVGAEISVEDAAKAARLCAINLISQMKIACGGDLERVQRIVKLNGFVNCIDSFADQPLVINGASNLLGDVFGERGRHSRSAVGVNALPLGVAVEIDALVEIS